MFNKGQRVWLVAMNTGSGFGGFEVEAGKVERMADDGRTVMVRRTIHNSDGRDTVVVDRPTDQVCRSQKEAALRAARRNHDAAQHYAQQAARMYELATEA